MTNCMGPTKNIKNRLMWLRFSSLIWFQPYSLRRWVISSSYKPVVRSVCRYSSGIFLDAPRAEISSSTGCSSSSPASRAASKSSRLFPFGRAWLVLSGVGGYALELTVLARVSFSVVRVCRWVDFRFSSLTPFGEGSSDISLDWWKVMQIQNASHDTLMMHSGECKGIDRWKRAEDWDRHLCDV